jgi:hypothetical protein
MLEYLSRSRINEPTVLMRFLGIILRVLRLQVSVYNVYITNQFQPAFTQGGRGVKSVSRGDSEYQGGKLLRVLSQLRLRIRPQFNLRKGRGDLCTVVVMRHRLLVGTAHQRAVLSTPAAVILNSIIQTM